MTAANDNRQGPLWGITFTGKSGVGLLRKGGSLLYKPWTIPVPPPPKPANDNVSSNPFAKLRMKRAAR